MQRFWIWPIALYLFLGGLGGGMMCFAMVVGTIVAPSAITSGALVFGVFVGFMCLLIGTALLVFELGQPWVFYRAFVTKTAVIKWGAVVLSISMVFGFIFILWEISWFSFFPFIPYEGLARLCLVVAGVAGACVMVYTGVLLSSMKSRPFWNTPALPLLFAVSALSTGAALLSMCVGTWPFPMDWLITPIDTTAAAEIIEECKHFLHTADAVLIICELAVLLLFVLLQFCASNIYAKEVARRWLIGEWKAYFWGLLVCCGLVIPLCLNLLGGVAGNVASPLIALAGGCLLRFMIVWSNDRRLNDGEDKYWGRLPQEHIDILDYWEPGREYWTETQSNVDFLSEKSTGLADLIAEGLAAENLAAHYDNLQKWHADGGTLTAKPQWQAIEEFKKAGIEHAEKSNAERASKARTGLQAKMNDISKDIEKAKAKANEYAAKYTG